MLNRIAIPPVSPDTLPSPAVSMGSTGSIGSAGSAGSTGSAGATAGRLTELLAAVLGRDVPDDADFYTDLGADSMVMARFCARVRKHPELPNVSMRDVYNHRSIAALAAELDGPAEGDAVAAEPSPVVGSVPATSTPTIARTWEYVLCGALQLLVFVGYTLVIAVVGVAIYQWVQGAPGRVEIYLRSVTAGAVTTVVLTVLPILAKWIIIGRWKPVEIRVWSLGYFRFWLVKTLIRSNPLALFVGSPLFTFYLRALGAKVGRNVTVLSRVLPVCTDLFTIGDGTVVRKDVVITGYRAHAGVIQIGPVTLGNDVVVGEASVLDIGTTMGDGSQLGHRSSLLRGQVVPAGERWHGAPARRTDADYRGPRRRPCGTLRRLGFVLGELAMLVLVFQPIAIGLMIELLTIPRVAELLGSMPHAFDNWIFYADAAAFAAVLVLGAPIVGMLIVVSVPRLLRPAFTEGHTYPLYGVHYSLHRQISRLTNSKMLTWYFGDSFLITGYLRAIGYDLCQVKQSGSNFGTMVRHETPYLVTIGSGTMVADGLSTANAEYSNTSFRVRRASIGADNFLGNDVVYPSGGRTGDNCLLATKVMVPIDGPVREGVGLLGSPAFEIPRSVERDGSFDHLAEGEEFARRLARKNLHNLRTIGLLVGSRWFSMFLASVVGLAALELSDRLGVFSIAAAVLINLVIALLYGTFVERAVTGFGRMTPQFCSIYDPYFWWHERFWKLWLSERFVRLLNGTPYKPMLWRLLGARVGRRVFDDGAFLIERSLVSIGSHCTLNFGSILQCHSQEDGSFKSDRTSLGDGVTVGVGALVHYGVTVGDGAVIAADSFVMKGEDVPAYSLWGGNPARQVAAGDPPRSAESTEPVRAAQPHLATLAG